MSSKIARYGNWESPISTDLLTGSISIPEVRVDKAKSVAYYLESRPSEKGRVALMQVDFSNGKKGASTEVTKANFNVRSGVHEYGGGALSVKDGLCIFSDLNTHRLFLIKDGNEPIPITPEDKPLRFADMDIHPSLEFCVAVMEDHTIDEPSEVQNSLVKIAFPNSSAAETAEPETVISGNDFYSAPRFNADGTKLAWIEWAHPNMPWSDSQLFTSEWNLPLQPKLVAGGNKTSVSQPRWASTGSALFYLSDETGFYNVWVSNDCDKGELLLKKPQEASYGNADWVFGQSTFVPLSDTQVLVTADPPTADSSIHIVSVHDGSIRTIQTPFITFECLSSVSATQVLLIAATKLDGKALYLLDIESGKHTLIKRSTEVDVADGYLSNAEYIAYPTTNDKTAYALLYLPKNQDYEAPKEEKPPLLVYCHGGPTSATPPGPHSMFQYWTSRGYAVCAVNYGGSTGYGKEYVERLQGNWGIVDVDDTCNVVKYLAGKGLIDDKRTAVYGGSAGGFTTLACLAFKPAAFSCGVSKYGVSSLEGLARDTHKFESRYLDGLVGGTIDEVPQLYVERAPLNSAKHITAPLLLEQGDIDKVVPKAQAEEMIKAIKSVNPDAIVDYVVYENEGHGFRAAENIKDTYVREEAFYRKVFKIDTEQ